MPEAAGLGLVLTIILSNSGQERRRLFGQHPQAHEELLVRKIVEGRTLRSTSLGSNETTTLRASFSAASTGDANRSSHHAAEHESRHAHTLNLL